MILITFAVPLLLLQLLTYPTYSTVQLFIRLLRADHSVALTTEAIAAGSSSTTSSACTTLTCLMTA